ncbi:unnamed protein product [Phytomonas sp. Hart1]|nr:unnamed protein product [Phytomonas sp. Hart1]|eukprot:CCW68669.1 unnamed protein product [Phytomonas sp. isolate Hart1]
MTAPLLDEVDTVMHNYFEALNSKDEDIFRLYEDNKRMRTLVQDTLKAREDLEAHSRSQAVLTLSLKTELHEKKCLIEAQDDEISTLREGIAELNVLFNSPSELSTSPQDIVLKVKDVVKQHDYLQAALNATNDHLNRCYRTALLFLIDEEARVRREMEDAAQQFFCSSIFWLCRQQAETISYLEADINRQRCAVEHERADFTEQLQLISKRLELDTTRNTLRTEGMNTKLAEMDRHLCVMQLKLMEEQERGVIALESMIDLVRDVWGPWCVVIERYRRHEFVERQTLGKKATDLSAQLHSLQKEHANTTGALESIQLTYRRHQKHGLKLEEKVRELDVYRNDLQELRLKHEKAIERFRKTEQRYQKNTLNATEALQESDKQLDEATKKSDRLTQQNGFLYKDVKTLEKRLEGLTKHAQNLEAQCQQLKKEKQVEIGENEAKVSSMENEIQKMRREYEGRLAEDKVAFQDQLKELESERDHWKGLLDQSKCNQTEQQKRFATEIGEWASLSEVLKAQLVEARAQLEKESTARKVLENSRRTESELLSRLIANSSNNTSMASPEKFGELTNSSFSLNHYSHANSVPAALVGNDGNELSSELTRALESEKLLRHQVQVLEQSCRRSTTVISELREALFRERIRRDQHQR